MRGTRDKNTRRPYSYHALLTIARGAKVVGYWPLFSRAFDPCSWSPMFSYATNQDEAVAKLVKYVDFSKTKHTEVYNCNCVYNYMYGKWEQTNAFPK